MEINIVSIMSAEEARQAVKEAKVARLAEEAKQEEERKAKCKAEALKRFPEVLKAISEAIEKATKEEKHSITFVLWERMADNIGYMPWADMLFIDDFCKDLFEKELGYSFDLYWYSDGWTTQTGKEGYFAISW